MIDFLLLIAQTTQPTTAPTGGGGGAGLFESPILLLLMFGLIFYFLLIRPQGREKKRRQEMLGGLKKNDRVVTIGGIIGTVTSVRDDEVTLKVDESSNTKITFSRSAIQRVMGGGPAEAAAAQKDAPPAKK